MRVIDLRVKAKDKTIAEGHISSIKLTELDADTGIWLTLDKGYSVIISMNEFDTILDYINNTEDIPDENKANGENNESIIDDEGNPPLTDLFVKAGACSICGSPIYVLSQSPYIRWTPLFGQVSLKIKV